MHRKARRTAKQDTAVMRPTHDVIIIGGGLAGGTLACLLGSAGLRVACIDHDDPTATLDEGFDGRTTAISWGSQKILAAAGVWDDLAPLASPIRTIDILDGPSKILLKFDAGEVGGDAFGWIFENRVIRAALYRRMKSLKSVDHIAPVTATSHETRADGVSVGLRDGTRLSAALLVGADGRASVTREWMGIESRGWSYDQSAIVCTVIHENPHGDTAVEHFRGEGPFAILPMQDDEKGRHRSSIVWTEHGQGRDSLLRAPQDVFDAALNARFPARYGRVEQIGKRFSFPLSLLHAHDYIAPRMALVADAGHGIHPIAGQGLNLGLRDIAVLGDLIVAARDRAADIGGDALLQDYQRQRRADNMAMAGTTDMLNRLFSNRNPVLGPVRRLGLRAVAHAAPAKKFFMRQAMGAAGILPEMIRNARENSGS